MKQLPNYKIGVIAIAVILAVTALIWLKGSIEQTEVGIEVDDSINLTPEQIELYFKDLRAKKTTDKKYSERLIDTFLNSIFLCPDGSMLILFNFSGDNNTLTIRDVEEYLSSNFLPLSGPE